DVRNAPVRVLVSLAVEVPTVDLHEVRQALTGPPELAGVEVAHALGHLADRELVLRAPYVEDLSVAHPVGVRDDALDAVDRVVDVDVAALVVPPVDELHLAALDEGAHEMGEPPRVPLLGGREVIYFGPDEVEGPHHRPVQPLANPVRVDDPLQELLRAAVDPAMLAHGAEDEV